MALKRQRLSQRRKVVGLTQESLAQRLGVERSTVARWEAGATEPVPSIRPEVARALDVSIDQLAELLAESQDADTARDAGVAIPLLPPKVQSEMWLGRTEFENLIRPQAAAAVETLPSDHPGDTDTADAVAGPDTPVPTTVGVGGFAGADVQRHRSRSRRLTRFAAAAVLALVGGAASVPLITSRGGPVAPAAVGNPAPVAPVAVIPAPDPGSSLRSEDSAGAPVAAPNKPADSPAPSVPAAAGTLQTIRSTSRSRPAASPPAPRAPTIPAQANAVWSRMAALSASAKSRTP